MRPDIRMQTAIIIRKNGDYLQGAIVFSDELRWSKSPYDAWRTRDRDVAKAMARMTGGVMVLFNPVARQIKLLGA